MLLHPSWSLPRIGRARTQRLLVLHADDVCTRTSERKFTVAGSGSYGVTYTVCVGPSEMTCTCLDFPRSGRCKHVYSVLIRCYGLMDDDDLRRPTTFIFRQYVRASHIALCASLQQQQQQQPTALVAAPVPKKCTHEKVPSRCDQCMGTSCSTTRVECIGFEDGIGSSSNRFFTVPEDYDDKCCTCLESITHATYTEKNAEALVACIQCKKYIHKTCYDQWRQWVTSEAERDRRNGRRSRSRASKHPKDHCPLCQKKGRSIMMPVCAYLIH